jgi:putative transposase
LRNSWDIRASPPSRLPDSRAGNMPVWYPSKRMQCIIKAESAKVEFAFLLEAEHDDEVVEFWDQPPPIELSYHDSSTLYNLQSVTSSL